MVALTKDELKSLLTTAKAHDERHWLMLLVSYCHGLRVSEMLALTGNNFKDSYLTVKRLKGSLKTRQPIWTEEKDAIDKLCTKVGDGLLFPSKAKHPRHQVIYFMKKYGKLAGIPEYKLHPHVLKHSIAVHSIKKAGIEYVKKYLGHKNGNSTLQYLKVDDDEASQAIGEAVGL